MIDIGSRWLTPSDVGRRDVEAVGDIHGNLSGRVGCGAQIGGQHMS